MPLSNHKDAADLARVQNAGPAPEDKNWFQRLGPGLVTGAADDDPSGIGTYSANGAQFGYGLLWLVPVCLPLMIAVQEMCGRIGAVTGHGLAAVLKEHYPKWLLFACVIALLGANIFNIYADLNVMAASSEMLLGVPFHVALAVITLVILLLIIFVPYHIYVKILKWLCLSLLGYVIVAVMPGVKNDWPGIIKSMLIPHLDFSSETVLAVVAFLGTTISPYLFFWQAGQTVEETIADGNSNQPGARHEPVKHAELQAIKTDTIIGMVASQVVAFFIMVCAAGTLHTQGITHIETAQDAAKALLPLGPVAYWIFTLCILGTGMLAVPTLAGSAGYAVAETAGWRYGLYRRFSRAKAFYITIAITVLIGYAFNWLDIISPIDALVYSAAINGIIAPPLIIVLLLICNNKKIMSERINHRISNILGWATVVFMGAAAGYLVYSMMVPKS